MDQAMASASNDASPGLGDVQASKGQLEDEHNARGVDCQLENVMSLATLQFVQDREGGAQS